MICLPLLRIIFRTAVHCCLIWMICYLWMGGTSSGNAFYKSFIADKTGHVLIGVVYPTFIAGTIASLLSCLGQRKGVSQSLHPVLDSLPTAIKCMINPLNNVLQRISCGRYGLSTSYGDTDMNRIGFRFLYIPLFTYTMFTIYRKCSYSEQTLDEYLTELYNCFGISTLLGCSILLVPAVSRHSIIAETLGYSHVDLIRLHIWLGRFIILGSFVHGIGHILRYISILHYPIHYILLPPPMKCWKTIMQSSESNSVNSVNITLSDDASNIIEVECYDLFRNWTGVMALFILFILSLSTLNYIRRKYYAIFYSIHIVTGPIFLILIILHWNRTMMYLTGSILYYVACSFPVMVEQFVARYRNTFERFFCRYERLRSSDINSNDLGPVDILAIEKIEESSNQFVHSPGRTRSTGRTAPIPHRRFVSVTFAATPASMQHFQSGVYVKVHVPSISNVAHPFTINKVFLNNEYYTKHKCTQQALRIIFLETGSFTKDLYNALCAEKRLKVVLPSIYMDGFHGTRNRLEQICNHDVISFIAGGIGITPYLSLLHDLLSCHCEDLQPTRHQTTISNNTVDGLFHISTSNDELATKVVSLHWVCRDNQFIHYIQKEYFDPLMIYSQNHYLNRSDFQPKPQEDDNTITLNTATIRVKIFIYRTDPGTKPLPSDMAGQTTAIETKKGNDNHNIETNGFQVSKYDSYVRHASNSNGIPKFLSFTLIVWVGFYMTWYVYKNVQHSSSQILLRSSSPILIILYGLVVSIFVHNCFPCRTRLLRSENNEWVVLKEKDSDSDNNNYSDDEISSVELGKLPLHHKLRRDGNHTASGLQNLDPSNANNWNESSNSSPLTTPTTLSAVGTFVDIEERVGRPSIHHIIDDLDNTGLHPGLFVCGPTTLMTDIRAVVAERSRGRCCQLFQSRNGLQQQQQQSEIALYEEKFEF